MVKADKVFYDKKIVYLDYFERNEKVKNGGFIKWEAKGDTSRVQIHIRGLYPTDTLQGEIQIISYGRLFEADSITLNFGTGEYAAVWKNDNLAGTGVDFEQCGGIQIRLSEKRLLKGVWQEKKAESKARAEEKTYALLQPETEEPVEKRETEKETSAESEAGLESGTGWEAFGDTGEENKEAEENQEGKREDTGKEAGEESREGAEKQVGGESESREEAGKQVEGESESGEESEKRAEEERRKESEKEVEEDRKKKGGDTGKESEEESREIAGREVMEENGEEAGKEIIDKSREENREEAKENTARNGVKIQWEQDSEIKFMENMEENKNKKEQIQLSQDKWEQLGRQYPRIHPFGDAREYLSITPRDFVVLSRQYQNLVQNSFLLHGYYNYGHVILTKIKEGSEDNYFLGVPGVYFDREKQAALLFGFEGFEAGAQRAQEGSFGYYMKRVEI